MAMTKQYRRALELAGMSPEETKRYKNHGRRWPNATLQKEYGDNLPDSEDMKATRHASTKIFRIYKSVNV